MTREDYMYEKSNPKYPSLLSKATINIVTLK